MQNRLGLGGQVAALQECSWIDRSLNNIEIETPK